MQSLYVQTHYGVPACIGRVVQYDGKRGIIYKDGGAHVAINLDESKPGQCIYVHPNDPALVFTDEISAPRKMTASQKRYSDYLQSETTLSFSEWIKCK